MSQQRIVVLVLTALLTATTLPVFAAPAPALTRLPGFGALVRAVVDWMAGMGAEGDPDGQPFDRIGMECEPGGEPLCDQ